MATQTSKKRTNKCVNTVVIILYAVTVIGFKVIKTSAHEHTHTKLLALVLAILIA